MRTQLDPAVGCQAVAQLRDDLATDWDVVASFVLLSRRVAFHRRVVFLVEFHGRGRPDSRTVHDNPTRIASAAVTAASRAARSLSGGVQGRRPHLTKAPPPQRHAGLSPGWSADITATRMAPSSPAA
jgi:hypothetical protein